METYKIFSKLNIRDYNNELEKILDNKLFSLDVKNLLLSMLYKIENSYKDYETIKVEVIPKKTFLLHILKIIKDKCFEIQFIKMDDENQVKDKNKTSVDRKKGKIICYPNEKDLLSAILYLGEENIEFMPKYPYIADALAEMIKIGSNMNHSEIIRDFNGWSWDILINEIVSIEYNIIYQTLLMLKGEGLVYINNQIQISDIEDEKQKELLLDELKNVRIIKDEKFMTILEKIVTKEFLKLHNERKEEILKIKIEKEKELELFNDKKKLIGQKTDEKKVYTEKIEKIDKMLNNTELLREEYTERNKKLPNKEKIFSISHLVERLERERNELLEKIKECNRFIQPKEFVKVKAKIEKEFEFLDSLEIDQKENKEETKKILLKDIICFCNEFFKIAEKQISKIESKNDIKDWIYKIRYYGYLPVANDIYLKDIEELQKGFEKVKKLLIKKAQENKLIDDYTEDKELLYQVINYLLQSKTINLENIIVNSKYNMGILTLEYYDGDILENTLEIKKDNVKIKKRIKIFI